MWFEKLLGGSKIYFMKRVGFLYDRLLDKEFIKQIIQKASKHKTKRKQVKKVLASIDEYTEKIYLMIKNNQIELRPTRTREILERGKIRTITISPFYPNQILDYLLVELTKPIIRKSMYAYCIGNVDKRGIMFGKKVMERKVKKYKYFMKLDIKHFYQNVKPQKLLVLFEKKIKDKKFLDFIRQVINKNELPIGCYYSQWFSNFYLCELDHYLKEQNSVEFMARYVDDMVFASNNKRKLKRTYHSAKQFIYKLDIEFKFLPIIRTFVNFLGFIFKKCITRLRHSIFYRLQRTKSKARNHLCFAIAKRLISYFSWLKNIPSGYSYYKNNIFPIVKLGKLRYIMSNGGI